MSMILFLSIETILLLFYCDVLRAEYALNNEEIVNRNKDNAKIHWENSALQPLDLPQPRKVYRNEELRHQIRRAMENDRIFADDDENSTPNNGKAKSGLVRSMMRNRFKSILEKVLEELLSLITAKMKKSSIFSRSLSQEPHSNNKASKAQESLEINYEDALIKEEPESTMDDSWLDEIMGLHKTGKKVRINRVTFPENFDIVSKLRKQKPNVAIANYDQGFPRP